jgi:hypothetical protein
MPTGADRGSSPPHPGELRALRDARSTWARLSVDRQLNRSLAKAPANPGPLNSHGLALRALQLMQSLSPAYLERFMAHVDALLWLDEASLGDAPALHPGARRDGDRKRREPTPGWGLSPAPRPCTANRRAASRLGSCHEYRSRGDEDAVSAGFVRQAGVR